MSNTALIGLREHLERRRAQTEECARRFAGEELGSFYSEMAEQYDQWVQALDEVTS